MSDNLKVGMASFDDMEVGEIYPLYGIVTNIEETDNGVFVEINNQLRLQLSEQLYKAKNILDLTKDKEAEGKSKIDVFKSRMWEKGIFMSKLLSKEPEPEFFCHMGLYSEKKKSLQSNKKARPQSWGQ